MRRKILTLALVALMLPVITAADSCGQAAGQDEDDQKIVNRQQETFVRLLTGP